MDRKGKLIKRIKRAFFRSEIYKTSGTQHLLTKLAKWARLRSQAPKDLPQFPPLKRRGIDGVINEFNEKAEILHAKFFPPPFEADLSDLATAVYS